MLHHHAGVLLDDDDANIFHDLHHDVAAAAAAAADATDDTEDVDKVRLMIVGGGGNCFSFGTHFNRRPMMLTLHSRRLSAACNAVDAIS